MKVKSVIRVDAYDLINRKKPEHITVTYGDNGKIQALSWLYGTSDTGLHPRVKLRGGVWDKNAGGWTFADTSAAQGLLEAIVKKHPDWPIIGDPSKPFMSLAGIHISRVSLGNGFDACLVPFPLPYFASNICETSPLVFLITSDNKKNEEVGLLIGSASEIAEAVDLMVNQGATCDDRLAKKWPFAIGSTRGLHVKVTGWAVQIACDLTSPLHYLAAPEQKYCWDAPYPYGTKKVAIPWTGAIHTTRKLWPSIKSKLLAAGLAWEGDNPEAELSVPAEFDASRVAGWKSPAPNGHLMHAYQKEGARFCASRGMRALIGDEMGVGKTVQAIAVAEAVGAPRILVVCPANARYVWEREILGWGGRGAIQHITSQLDKLDMAARWHIVTYDLIAARAEAWQLKDKQEVKAFVEAFPAMAEKIENEKKPGGYPRKVALDRPLDKVPAFADPRRLIAWEKVMQRLRGELLAQFLAAGMLVILDEAHRAKNKTAKRTKAIQRLAASGAQILMLTGTPLRNNEHEAAVLLGLLDAEAAAALSKERGYTIQDVKDYLDHFMIRRTKAEVLPELPEKTRQRIDISELDHEQMEAYHAALVWAEKSYRDALKDNASEAAARRAMQGGIEQARTALGIAKVRGGGVADLVVDVVENKSCCVVFCAHHQASDELKAQLEKLKLRVAVVDGRVSQKDRAAIVQDFQEGRLDVFIGGINAAGEAITLTRADTVVFVELDWVPAALLQAEDRIHRVGQRKNCQVIQLVARMQGDNLDEMMVELIGSKLARIGAVLNEGTANIIAGDIQSELHGRLLATANAVNAQKPDVAEEPVAAEKPERKRGRPKIYIDKAPPTATERSKHSIKALATAGGKRVMLRLTPEAHEALKVIMAITGGTQETATINQALVARKQDLLNASTQTKSTIKYE